MSKTHAPPIYCFFFSITDNNIYTPVLYSVCSIDPLATARAWGVRTLEYVMEQACVVITFQHGIRGYVPPSVAIKKKELSRDQNETSQTHLGERRKSSHVGSSEEGGRRRKVR